MRKKILVYVFVLVFFMAVPTKTECSTGIGVIIGEPTGLSLKFNNFPILGIAWSFDDYIHVHCDFWLNNYAVSKSVNWYFGIGGKMLIYKNGKGNKDDKIGLGARLPIGLQGFVLKNLEIFGEIVPGLMIVPSTDFDVDAGVGVRLHF